jgi:hypothetical protein
MAQDERPMLEENQKDEVSITVDGSKEATTLSNKITYSSNCYCSNKLF